jgi:UDP-glucose 4-epimerase
MKSKMEKVVVTGGAGFIGSHLCEKLKSKYEVYSIDNYFTGSERNHIAGVTYIRASAAEIGDHISFIPKYIFHLGEYSRVEQSFQDIEKVWEYNKIGILGVLEFVRKTGAKLIYAGSSTKFGDGGLGRNQSPYAWAKASNTELVVNYGNWFDIPYAITYFYNVYGLREIKSGKYATLIALFAEKMKNNEKLTVVKPGNQIRNFTHIDDIIDALMLIGENGFGDEFGIGAKESFSVLEIAKMFGGDVELLPARKGNRITAEVMIEKTEGLGWKQKHKVQDYIEKIKNKGRG